MIPSDVRVCSNANSRYIALQRDRVTSNSKGKLTAPVKDPGVSSCANASGSDLSIRIGCKGLYDDLAFRIAAIAVQYCLCPTDANLSRYLTLFAGVLSRCVTNVCFATEAVTIVFINASCQFDDVFGMLSVRILRLRLRRVAHLLRGF